MKAKTILVPVSKKETKMFYTMINGKKRWFYSFNDAMAALLKSGASIGEIKAGESILTTIFTRLT
jgi:hypothetical protein